MATTDSPDHGQYEYFVALTIDGSDRLLEVADHDTGAALAEQILSAAEHRTTLRLTINDRQPDGVQPIGAMVVDFAQVTRIEVFVDSRALSGGSVGIKR